MPFWPTREEIKSIIRWVRKHPGKATLTSLGLAAALGLYLSDTDIKNNKDHVDAEENLERHKNELNEQHGCNHSVAPHQVESSVLANKDKDRKYANQFTTRQSDRDDSSSDHNRHLQHLGVLRADPPQTARQPIALSSGTPAGVMSSALTPRSHVEIGSHPNMIRRSNQATSTSDQFNENVTSENNSWGWYASFASPEVGTSSIGHEDDDIEIYSDSAPQTDTAISQTLGYADMFSHLPSENSLSDQPTSMNSHQSGIGVTPRNIQLGTSFDAYVGDLQTPGEVRKTR